MLIQFWREIWIFFSLFHILQQSAVMNLRIRPFYLVLQVHIIHHSVSEPAQFKSKDISKSISYFLLFGMEQNIFHSGIHIWLLFKYFRFWLLNDVLKFLTRFKWRFRYPKLLTPEVRKWPILISADLPAPTVVQMVHSFQGK